MDTDISTGIRALDGVIQGLRLGDNVVLQIDSLEDYAFFAGSFADQAVADGRECVYLRFAPHPPVVDPQPGIALIEVDPSDGFDSFSSQVNRIIEERGTGVFCVMDNLSALVEEWATDELLANFFQITCPYLFELDTITYFALTRGRHSHAAVARIRDTTQVLLDIYHVDGKMYVHPLKVWDRYSPQMFLPHGVDGDKWSPVFQSGDAAAVSAIASKHPLRGATSSIAPWESIYSKLIESRNAEPSPESDALKSEFTRMLMGSHPEFNRLADEYFTLDDLFEIRDRLVGSGRIGGKAAGMLLARKILGRTGEFDGVMEAHDSFYIGSDVFFTFLVNNDLFRLRLRMTRASRISHEEFAAVEERFLQGRFPPGIMEQFRNMLDYFGQAPIIVRSSSLLEDSFGNAFAGKYRSEFCANQGSPEERLDAFLRAVKRVYASALNPDALSYRRKRGLGERDEQMAILVQRVSGMPHGKYFFPTVAGVALSRNLYAWSDRIDPEKGVIRLVFGLGTRAVERVGDYPRMIAISEPLLRPEMDDKIAKYSQRQVDLLDLEENSLVTLPASRLLRGYPNLHLLVSVDDGYIRDPITNIVDGSKLVLTFNNLIRRTEFVRTMESMLVKLEHAYGHPLDTEFTAHVDSRGQVSVNLLQCRPLFTPGQFGPVVIPDAIPGERLLFQADRMVGGGIVSGIRFILFIDPDRYAAQPLDVKTRLGRLVGQINEHPAAVEDKIVMMGPGRWGSSNIALGVNVGYGDIDNASALVEIARVEAGHTPELSYGTHFFQDLVEAGTIYLPVHPSDPASRFNAEFFDRPPNALTDLLPEAGKFGEIARLIDVPAVTNGLHACIVADPQSCRAVCFLSDQQP